MIGTTLSCIFIFLLVNAALFHVLHMIASWDHRGPPPPPPC